MLRLTKALSSSLLEQPESGMGFQRVRATFSDSSRLDGVAYNAELLLWESEPKIFVSKTAFAMAVAEAAPVERSPIRSLTLRYTVVVPLHPVSKSHPKALGAAINETQILAATSQDVFVRFCAYQNDRRVTSQGGLLRGSYATTNSDSRHVTTGTQAVDRYALPNPMPAIFRISVKDAGAKYRRGIAQPAYGHNGGGIEVLFDDGTSPGSVTQLPNLPP